MTHLAKYFFLFTVFTANIAGAHFLETIGYEFEDYNIQVLQNVGDNEIKMGPLFFLGSDVRPDYQDCEIRSIPLKISEIKDNFSINFFKEIALFYRNLRNDISENKYVKYEKKSFFSEKEYQTFASYPKLLSPWKSPKKQGDPNFDVGPQVTFSLDIRKVWDFLKDSFLSSYMDAYSRNNLAMSVYVVDKQDKPYSELVRSPKDLKILKGFVALGLYYISDYLKIAGEKESVSKFKHPLYLKTSFPSYYSLVLEKLDKSKLDKLKESISEIIKDYVKARFRDADRAKKLEYEEFSNEVFSYWLDLNRNKIFTTKVFYDRKITSFSDFESRNEKVWGSNNPNQYVYFELRNLRSIFAEQNYAEKKFGSRNEMYQQYAISEKEAILLVNDFTENLIKFHAQQAKDVN